MAKTGVKLLLDFLALDLTSRINNGSSFIHRIMACAGASAYGNSMLKPVSVRAGDS